QVTQLAGTLNLLREFLRQLTLEQRDLILESFDQTGFHRWTEANMGGGRLATGDGRRPQWPVARHPYTLLSMSVPTLTSRQHPFVQRCRLVAAGRGEQGEVLLDGPHLVRDAV